MNSKIFILSKKDSITNIIESNANKDDIYFINVNCKEIFNTEQYFRIMEELLKLPNCEEDWNNYLNYLEDLSWIKEEKVVILFSYFNELFLQEEASKKNIMDLFNKDILINLSKNNDKVIEEGDESKGKIINIYLDFSRGINNQTHKEIIFEVLFANLVININLNETDKKRYYERSKRLYNDILISCIEDNYELIEELCKEVVDIESKLLPVLIDTMNDNFDEEEMLNYYSELTMILAKNKYFNKKNSLIAKYLRDIYLGYIENLALISEYIKNKMSIIISETIVDINYASDINTSLSIRMGRAIEENKYEKKINEKHNELLEELSMVNNNLNNLRESFDESIKYDKYKDELFDNLHRELTQYKNGLVDKIIDNIAIDLIRMIDSTKKTIDIYDNREFSEQNYKRLLGLFYGVVEDIQDILFRQNIESYEVDGDEVDVKKQKIISTVITTEPELNNKIAKRLADGYEKNGRILRHEKINIYKYKG